MRTFISISLSNEAIEEIKRIQKELEKKNLFYGKFTELENLHLTLKFLGEIDEEKIKEVRKKLKEVKFEKFIVRWGNVGVFTPSLVKVIWVKLEGTDILQKEIDNALKEIFKPEYRFMSHITLARVKRVKDKISLFKSLKEIKIKNIEFFVDKFYLMKSELFSQGPKYSLIEEFSI